MSKEDKLVQILENENFLPFADFENNEIWLLNRTLTGYLDLRIINIPEITESSISIAEKLPKVLTKILEKHGKLDYQIVTDNPENYKIFSYICEYDKFKIKELITYDQSGIDC